MVKVNLLHVWLYNIYYRLKELADIKYQSLLWKGEIPDRISSFIELYASLFDDFNLDLFIDDEMPKLNVTGYFITEFNKLRDMMNEYDENGKNDTQILEDPEWHKISDQAKIVRDYWERELGVPQQPE